MLGSHKSNFVLPSALLELINLDVFEYVSHYIKYGNALLPKCKGKRRLSDSCLKAIYYQLWTTCWIKRPFN